MQPRKRSVANQFVPVRAERRPASPPPSRGRTGRLRGSSSQTSSPVVGGFFLRPTAGRLGSAGPGRHDSILTIGAPGVREDPLRFHCCVSRTGGPGGQQQGCAGSGAGHAPQPIGAFRALSSRRRRGRDAYRLWWGPATESASIGVGGLGGASGAGREMACVRIAGVSLDQGSALASVPTKRERSLTATHRERSSEEARERDTVRFFARLTCRKTLRYNGQTTICTRETPGVTGHHCACFPGQRTRLGIMAPSGAS